MTNPAIATAAAPALSGPQARRRRRATLAFALWATFVLATLALMVAGMPARFDELLDFGTANSRALRDLPLGFSPDYYAGYVMSLGIVTVLAHLLISAVISWRRPDDLMALFVSLVLVTSGAINPLSPVHSLADSSPALEPAVGILVYFGLISVVALLYVFPTGRFVPRWTALAALAWAALALPAVLTPGSAISFLEWPLVLQVLILLGLAASGVFAQIYRYVDVSSPVQRQQTKWAALGLSAAVMGPMAFFVPFFILPSLSDASMSNIAYQRVGSDFFALSVALRVFGLTGLAVSMLLFPISLAVAIMRYRLWDVDVVVNRTLVYAAVTGTLLLVYFVTIAVLELFFRALTGQGSAIVVVVSTLVIAALFQPLRRRAQDWIDRRFYRQKYDSAKTLAAFSATMRDQVDLNHLRETLTHVVEETMQPAYVSMWLRDSESEAEQTNRS